MKTIIIPGHCGSACIDQLKLALNIFEGEEIHCILLQIRPMPDNYNDLMMLHRNPVNHQFFDESFSRSMSILNEHYGDRLTVRADFLYGDSPAVFRNYVQHRKADLVIYDNQKFQSNKKQWNLNVFRMVRRCGCELMYISKNTSGEQARNFSWIQRKSAHTPESVAYQYAVVNHQLDGLEEAFNSNKMISTKISNLSRYFLNEAFLQKMLAQSECSLLLLKK